MDDGDGDTDDDNADNNEEDDDGTTHPSFSLDNLQWISEKGGNSCRSSAFGNGDQDGDDDDDGHEMVVMRWWS